MMPQLNSFGAYFMWINYLLTKSALLFRLIYPEAIYSRKSEPAQIETILIY